jgi:NAD+ synthase (glutamine-hydrolysing)
MRLAFAQINSVVGDLDGNRDRILARLDEARYARADLVLFPELAVTGYPPEDLLLRPGFIRAARQTTKEIAARVTGIAALLGAPHFDDDLYNACFVCANGRIESVYRKRFLPNYGVFDEDRYFAPGRDLFLIRIGETLVGPTICEDIWQPGPPATDMALAGAQLIANISASPFHVGKDREREEMLRVRARDNACFVALCNAVGGQDELVFAGHSVVIDDEGELVARAPGFEEALLVVDLDPVVAVGRRLRDVRRRSLARENGHAPVTTVEL